MQQNSFDMQAYQEQSRKMNKKIFTVFGIALAIGVAYSIFETWRSSGVLEHAKPAVERFMALIVKGDFPGAKKMLPRNRYIDLKGTFYQRKKPRSRLLAKFYGYKVNSRREVSFWYLLADRPGDDRRADIIVSREENASEWKIQRVTIHYDIDRGHKALAGYFIRALCQNDPTKVALYAQKLSAHQRQRLLARFARDARGRCWKLESAGNVYHTGKRNILKKRTIKTKFTYRSPNKKYTISFLVIRFQHGNGKRWIDSIQHNF